MMMKMKIEILGDGCSRCDKFYQNVIQAVKESGKEAEIVKVMDSQKFSSYGVLSLPGLVINGVLKVSGRVSKVETIKDWIQ
ncbi:MAG TPA: thioredoxin family protein [Thermodesulfobacteriota bacterium]|nr:thioredoxin family protein [Thermodesulfobacteriota bacterium]